ncbi:PKD repeat protein [Pedobacter sp. UYP24]
MKKILKPILFLLCAASFAACEKDRILPVESTVSSKLPFVDFEFVPKTDPFTFDFNNKSTNYKSLEWRFGDDSLSTEVSPNHMFPRDGKYEVVLTATSLDGAKGKKLIIVDIQADKVAKIVALPNGTLNTVKFKISTTAELKSAKWDFGDGTTSTELEPTKAYAVGKLFTAKVVLTTKNGAQANVKKLVSSNGTLEDVTKQFLKNTGNANANDGPPFIAAQRVGGRWGIVADWNVNAAVKQREGNMGSWDQWEGNTMSMEKWGGGEFEIVDGKIQQTSLAPLPAGQYFYQIGFHDFSVKDKLYNAVSKATSLPDANNVETDPNVLGWTKISGSNSSGTPGSPITYTTAFNLAEQRTVTFGFVATFQQNEQNFKLYQVKLYRQDK